MNSLRILIAAALLTLCSARAATPTLFKDLTLNGISSSRGTVNYGPYEDAVFLSGATATFASGSTLTISGALGGTPASGTLSLANLTLTLPATVSGGGSSFQPLDSDLTAIAALTTTSFGRGLLDDADASAARTSLGLVTVASSGSAADLSTGTLAAARMPALTGDITTSAGAVATTLATVNSNVGTFGSATASPVVTVNGKGLITAVSNTTITPAASSLTGTLNAAQMPAHTGDATSSAGSVALTLATVNSNVGTFGAATTIPAITVNGKGLVTAVSNTTITNAAADGATKGIAAFTAADFDASSGVISLDYTNGQAASTSVKGFARLATSAETLTGTSTTLVNTPAGAAYAAAALRNALAPRGGIAFDGTNSTGVSALLTGQAIATDPFSLVSFSLVPSATVSTNTGNVTGLSSSSTGPVAARSVHMFWSGDDFIIRLYGASTSDYRQLVYTGLRTSYSGEALHLAGVFNAAATPILYVNGAAISGSESTTGTAPAWGETITSTYLVIGIRSSTQVLATSVYSASFYNLALSAADALEIYKLNGAVPFRFQFGTQSALYASDFSAGADSWASTRGTSAGNIDAIGGQDDVLRHYADATAGATHYVGRAATPVKGKKYRLKFSYYIPSANATAKGVRPYINGGTNFTGQSTATATDAWTAWSTDTDFDGSNVTSIDLLQMTAGGLPTFTGANSVTDDLLYIKNFSLVRLGAVVHLPLDDGIGYQLHDASTNKLDALMTTTGVSHLIAKRSGFVRGTLTWAGTHEPKSLLGQRAFPDGTLLDSITYLGTASSSGTGLTLGTTTTAAKWVTSDTYTLNVKEVGTLAARLPTDATANQHDLVADPDSANYTGSITVEAVYRVTEGTP